MEVKLIEKLFFEQIKALCVPKRSYIDWDRYKKKIDFIDDYYWQQGVRKQSIRNSEMILTKNL